jgi:MFS family permease
MIFVFSSLYRFLKMMVTIELFLPLMVMIGTVEFFMALLYICLGDESDGWILCGRVSINYNWQHFYVIMAVACFVLALIHWIFMHDKYFALKVPLHYIDWLSILLFISTFMFSAYVYSFGKQQDWLNSKNIINASIAAFVSFALLCSSVNFKKTLSFIQNFH